MVTTPDALPMASVSTGLEPHLTTVRDRFPSPCKVSPEHEDERMMACSRGGCTLSAPAGVWDCYLGQASALRAGLVTAKPQGVLPVAVGACHAAAAGVQRVAGHRDRDVAAAVHLGQGKILRRCFKGVGLLCSRGV